MPGEYVLTAMWNGKPLHFQINTAIVDGKKEFHVSISLRYASIHLTYAKYLLHLSRFLMTLAGHLTISAANG